MEQNWDQREHQNPSSTIRGPIFGKRDSENHRLRYFRQVQRHSKYNAGYEGDKKIGRRPAFHEPTQGAILKPMAV